MEFVYVMKNMANGYYKIGRSNHPQYRERTLQCEEPDVRLLATRDGSREVEQSLQRKFSSHRLRGEWFLLRRGDLYELASALSTTVHVLDPPFRVIESKSGYWIANLHRYSPQMVWTLVFERKSQKLIFEAPFELSRAEIASEVEALVCGCRVPDAMYKLLATSLRNYVRDRYPEDEPAIELRELCCIASGESRGFQVVDRLRGSWYFVCRAFAQVVFDRLKRSHDDHNSN